MPIHYKYTDVMGQQDGSVGEGAYHTTDLSSILRIIKMEGENKLNQVFVWPALTHHTHTHMHNLINQLSTYKQYTKS